MKKIMFVLMICLMAEMCQGGVFVYKNRRYRNLAEFQQTAEYHAIKDRVKTANAEKPKTGLVELSEDLKLIKKWRSGQHPFMQEDMDRAALKQQLLQGPLQVPSAVKRYEVLH